MAVSSFKGFEKFSDREKRSPTGGSAIHPTGFKGYQNLYKLDVRGIKMSLRGAKYNLKILRGTKVFNNPVWGTK